MHTEEHATRRKEHKSKRVGASTRGKNQVTSIAGAGKEAARKEKQALNNRTQSAEEVDGWLDHTRVGAARKEVEEREGPLTRKAKDAVKVHGGATTTGEFKEETNPRSQGPAEAQS